MGGGGLIRPAFKPISGRACALPGPEFFLTPHHLVLSFRQRTFCAVCRHKLGKNEGLAGIFARLVCCLDDGVFRRGGLGKSDVTEETAALIEYRFDWYAICRCEGGLCSSEGCYKGRHRDEEEAVARMKAQVNKQLEGDNETFLKFDYEKR